MRWFLSSFASEHFVITVAAYVSLALTLFQVLWGKFTELVHAVWTSTKNAIRDVLAFYDELRRHSP